MATLLSVATVESYSLRFGNRARESQSAGVGIRGFGVRVKPSGVKSYLIQYRNAEGRTRRLVLGQHGALTPEAARDLARKKLTAVAAGEDPSADRHATRAGMTVADVCDWYIREA